MRRNPSLIFRHSEAALRQAGRKKERLHLHAGLLEEWEFQILVRKQTAEYDWYSSFLRSKSELIAANIQERRRKSKGKEVKEQRKKAKVSSPSASGLQDPLTMKKKNFSEKGNSNEEATETNAMSAGKTTCEQERKTAGWNV
jgi:hypothetical protein